MRNKKIIDDDSLLSMQEENIKKNAGKVGKRKLMTTAVVLLLVAGVTVPTAIYLEKRNVSVDIDPNIEILEEYTINVRRGTYIKDLALQKIEGYTFIGFYKDAELTKPYNENDRLTKDTTIYAKYEINIYTLSFPTGPAFTIEGDGIEDNQVELEYNSEYSFKLTLNPGYEDVDIAVRINDEILTPNQDGYYTIKIDEDTAVYIDGVEINSYSVTFYDSVEKNELYQTQDIKYYELCTYSGVTPTKHSTPIYEYTFIGWMDSDGETVDLSTTHIVCDLELFANFSEEYIEYTITKPEQVIVKFQDLYLSNSATLHYGDIVEITYDTTEGYRVTSFNVSGAEKIEGSENQYRITGNLEIIYEEVIQTFTIQILSNNEDYGKVNASSITVDYGTEIKVSRSTISIGAITITATPTTNNAQYSYSFDGWDTGSVTVTHDLTITATFTQTVNTYTVTWLNWDGSVLERDKNIPYGTMPEYNGKTPTRENTETTLYEYIGWDETVSVVTGDVTYTAVFDETSLILPYEVNENGEITKYTGTATEIEIPTSYSLSSDGTPIYGTDIPILGIVDASSSSMGAFANKEITSVTIPETIEKIGDYAFYNCVSLTDVNIPNTVTSIGGNSFGLCTELTKITIPEGVTTIGAGAFSGCVKLESVSLPKSITSVGYNAFVDCHRINDVYYGGNANDWVSISFSSHYNSSNAYSNPLAAPSWLYGTANLYINGNELLTDANIDTATQINAHAFEGYRRLNSITLGEQVTSIGAYAFNNCSSLVIVRYPGDINDWVTKISFEKCNDGSSNPLHSSGHLYVNGDELVTDAIIDTATYINPRAFRSYKALNSITLGKQVTRIGDSAFVFCDNLKDVYYAGDINDWVTKTGNGDIFDGGANLYVNGDELVTDVNIDRATTISSGAFMGCKSITSVTIGNQVTSIGEEAFQSCTNLSSVKIGNKVTSIGNYAFSGCMGLTEIVLPSSLRVIGFRAFRSCSGLSTITIPDSVTWIADGAFESCYSLVYVVNKSSEEFSVGNYGTSIEDNPILEIVSDESDVEFVDIGGNRYKDYNGVRNFIKNLDRSREIVIDSTCDRIYQYAFYCRDDITSVTIPNGVTSIGRSAFSNCRNLAYVTIESSSVYRDADGTGYDDCGALLESALEVRVLISCIEDSTNSYLENASNFTKTTSEDGLYYIYNKI